jgi:hypothetical protein
MLFRSRKKTPSIDPASARELDHALQGVRDHWDVCAACREAAAASGPLWCEKGLELMRRGVADHAHFDECARCASAQERVRSGQCDLGRQLEDDVRVLVRRLAGA